MFLQQDPGVQHKSALRSFQEASMPMTSMPQGSPVDFVKGTVGGT